MMIRMVIRMRLLAHVLLLLLVAVVVPSSTTSVVDAFVVSPSSSDTKTRRIGTIRRTRNTRTWLYDDDEKNNAEPQPQPQQQPFSTTSSSTKTSPSPPPLLNAIDLRLLQAILQLDSGSSELIPVRYAGETQLPTSISTVNKDDDQQSSKNVTCAVVAEALSSSDDDWFPQQPGLVLPLSEQSRLLVPNEDEEGWKNIFSSSRLELWRQNLVYVLNRDDGIYDNLPYTKWWSNDEKQKQQRDAANNLLQAKYHMGKRELYNLMLGKDWYRTERELPSSSGSGVVDASTTTKDDDTDASASLLAERIRQIQKQELQMLLAECESQLAIQKQQKQNQQELQEQKLVLTQQLEQLLLESSSSSRSSSYNNDKNIDEEEDRSSRSRVLPPEAFTNSYELLRAIVNLYMDADFLAIALENSSLLEDGMTCGGALILKRKVTTETMTVLGEQLQVTKDVDDENDDDGDLVLGGELYVVECSFDEALSISECCAVPLYAETDFWQSGAVMVEREVDDVEKSSTTTAWKTLDPELSILIQGQSKAQAPTERAAPIRLERTLLNDFADDDDSTTDSSNNKSNKQSSKNLFPQDNLVTSLAQFDALDNDDKARMLLSMSNTRYLLLGKGQQQLPRPRTVRKDPNILNEWMLPLVDESVRKQYLIRQAMEQQQQGDGDNNDNNSLVQELMNTKSKRLIALEKAEMATDKAVKDYWTNEAQFYESLRADITQDVGSYSRFLDRDEWYERTRQIQAKKLDKSKFGNLLDGIE